MSQRRSHILILSCYLFTSLLLLSSIELGEGLQCYSCNSIQDSECLSNPKNTTECPKPPTTVTPEPTTTVDPNSTTTVESKPTTIETPAPVTNKSESSDNELENGQSDSNDWLGNFVDTFNTSKDEYECFRSHLTDQNGTEYVLRGCAKKNKLNCESFEGGKLKKCDIMTCNSDKCNSSNMEKMGIISLLLPLIAALLRTR